MSERNCHSSKCARLRVKQGPVLYARIFRVFITLKKCNKQSIYRWNWSSCMTLPFSIENHHHLEGPCTGTGALPAVQGGWVCCTICCDELAIVISVHVAISIGQCGVCGWSYEWPHLLWGSGWEHRDFSYSWLLFILHGFVYTPSTICLLKSSFLASDRSTNLS